MQQCFITLHNHYSKVRLCSCASKVRNTCNNSKHHPLLAFGWTTHNGLWMEYPLSLHRPGLGSNVSSVWCVACTMHYCFCAIALYISPHYLHLCLCTSPNSISMHHFHVYTAQTQETPHTHTVNTNHGNPSVVQSFWCWEVDQTKAPECSTANWPLHNVTASLI